MHDRERVQVAQLWKMEIGGQNADDLVGHAVNGNGTAHHPWIGAVAAPPQLVRDQDDLIPSGNIFIDQKHTSKLRVNPEQRKQLRGHACSR